MHINSLEGYDNNPSPGIIEYVLRFGLFLFLKLHRFNGLEEYIMLVSHTQLLLRLNDVALEGTNKYCILHSLQVVRTTVFL